MTSHSHDEAKVINNQGLRFSVVDCHAGLGRTERDWFSPFALIQDLVRPLYWLPGQPVEPREDPVSGLAGEVSGGHHTPVILPDGLVQEDPGPLPGPELCVTDELNSARLHAVHEDSLADDEGVRV